MSTNPSSSGISVPSFSTSFVPFGQVVQNSTSFVPYGQVVPNQRQLVPEHVEFAQVLLNSDHQNRDAASLNSLQSRSFTQIFPLLPQEPEQRALSQEERDQIWVMEPKVTVDTERNVKKVIVRKNSKDWARALYVDDAIVNSTPKDYIADGENTEFYDEEGKFICGIVYGIDVEKGAIQRLAPLACSTAQRGPGAGLIADIEGEKEKLKEKGYNVIKPVGDGWALRYKKEEGKGQYSTFANRHYSTTYGVTGSSKSKTVDNTAASKASALQTLQPYFRQLSDCFMQKFPGQYMSHIKAMMGCGGNFFYQPGAIFSSMVINCHEIDEKGKEIKNSRPAIHIDDGHHPDAFEVMLTLKENIEGGDLYLPEYGILLKLKDCSVTCFKATLLKHTVTKVGREDISKKACRVSAVAHMYKFSNDALKIARANWQERTERARLGLISGTGLQPAAGALLPQPALTSSPYQSQLIRGMPLPTAVNPNQPQPTATTLETASLHKEIMASQVIIQQLKAANAVLFLEKQVAESKLETANLKITLLTEKLRKAEKFMNQNSQPAIPQSDAAPTGQGIHQTLTTTTTTDTRTSFESFKRGQSDVDQEDTSLLEPAFKRPRIEKQ